MEVLLIIMLAPLALALGVRLLSPTVWFSVLVAACLVALVVA